MIVESVVLPVMPGREADFEQAFAQAAPLIERQPGYGGHTLRRGIEHPSTYLLTVHWENVAAHEDGFRASSDYQQWKRLLHGFYEPFPTVLHYGAEVSP
ncbi:antibiotic biosynthesis monooxygenase family protein [Demequina activiva]|uniref:Antibiotic biosynthesis monooxygenase n=1 Tax=Demequina activiva TaxID=1582364 RepID=A0A919UJ37_9MICO|nr:antibiotic biosynthesis monooxygenase [Demequina activiva]GIG53981.1 antibiotic biosynthesis monooxygenase [Demequina activiva]